MGDALTLRRSRTLSLTVRGPTAAAAGNNDDNLVLKAARALADRVEGLRLGRFVLSKQLAGRGGAWRRLGRRRGRAASARARQPPRAYDARLMEAARATGADVPVCLDPRPRVMRGVGEILSDPLDLPRLPAVLVNPGVAVPTKDVFARCCTHHHGQVPQAANRRLPRSCTRE